ncbi:hypothetical protein ACN0IV_12915 [Trabulsiella odontotermitis]|uniref:hypothetical protein n=1 Tax=Trabulsiella odontotermitis TaxID=379893 RepID=UPI003ACB0979
MKYKRIYTPMILMWLLVLILPPLSCGLLAVAESLENRGCHELAKKYVGWGASAIVTIWIAGLIFLMTYGEALKGA